MKTQLIRSAGGMVRENIPTVIGWGGLALLLAGLAFDQTGLFCLLVILPWIAGFTAYTVSSQAVSTSLEKQLLIAVGMALVIGSIAFFRAGKTYEDSADDSGSVLVSDTKPSFDERSGIAVRDFLTYGFFLTAGTWLGCPAYLRGNRKTSSE